MQKALFVVERAELWPHEIPGADVAVASRYLAGAPYDTGAYDKVYNLCDATRYQGQGFYVSMLAEARGHQPVPNLRTIEDFDSRPVFDLLVQEMEPLLAQLGAAPSDSDTLEVDAYFGADPTGRFEPLARRAYALVRFPLLRTRFRFVDGRGKLDALEAIALADVPESHRAALVRAATHVVSGARRVHRVQVEGRPSVAILHNEATDAPSNPEALLRFVRAATKLGMRASIIDKHSIDRLHEYHALFIRDTTNLNDHTYEFARKAAALGLVVIDDPESILQCNNKVFLHELLTRHKMPMPRSLLVHKDNISQVAPTVGLPCVLKQPDSAFSLGVTKVGNETELRESLARLLEKSDLVIAQEFLPTAFDWRVGILDRRPLFACRYFMAPDHWQVIKRDDAEGRVEGETATVPLGEVPEIVMRSALDAANLIGAGFYGVDLKQVGKSCYVIEVNDNPNVDAGNEDAFLGDALYGEIMAVIKRRIGERVPQASAPPAPPTPEVQQAA